ncbi:hypothetical protein NDU88_003701 [Pleurodeles waltl]|uniref:Uncharacterized protein n=1 Tax=Pleurodeles waltl TaxID=8319 RepID=A0AAV7QAE8_PLEWA|nr:hypothetical protein NDU88_003701 [Pleurodeles waltl]
MCWGFNFLTSRWGGTGPRRLRPPGSRFCPRFAAGSGRARPHSTQAPPAPILKRPGALPGTSQLCSPEGRLLQISFGHRHPWCSYRWSWGSPESYSFFSGSKIPNSCSSVLGRALDVPRPLGGSPAPTPDVLGVRIPHFTLGGTGPLRLHPPGSQFCPRFAAGSGRACPHSSQAPPGGLLLQVSFGAVGESKPPSSTGVRPSLQAAGFTLVPPPPGSPWAPVPLASVLQSPSPAAGAGHKHRSPPIRPSLSSGHGQSLVLNPLLPTGPTPPCRLRLSPMPA